MLDTDPFLERGGAAPSAAAPASAWQPWRSLLLLRVGVGMLLLTEHAVEGARGAYHFLWNEKPWALVKAVHEAGLPYAALLSPLLALLMLSICLSLLLGFLTRLFAALLLALLAFLILRSPAALAGHSELLWLYALCALTLLQFGSGRFSLDALFHLGEAWANRPQRRTPRV